MKTFFVGIKGVIVKDGKVLVLKTKNQQADYWELPGGRIDSNESIHKALLRELNEELPGIKNPQIHEVLDTFRVKKDIKNDISLVLIFYRVTAEFDGDPQVSLEHSEARWHSAKEASELVHQSNVQAIKNVLKK